MSVETIAEQDIVQESSNLTPFPKPWWGKLLVSLLVTAIPTFSFFAVELIKPEWQSGRLSDYVILFLFPEASLLFFPLLAYSIICYLLLLHAPARYSPSFLIRFGVYSGVLLSLHYSIVIFLYFIDLMVFTFLLAWILPVVFLWIYRWARTKWEARLIHKTMIAFAIGAYLVSAVVMRDLGAPFFLVLIVLIMAAPFWSLLLAVQATVWLYKNHESLLTFPRGAGFATWIIAYIAALRFDILKMYELYDALPPTPPDCYIATAAARGHPRFVHAWTVQRADGKFMQVNIQLQRLKCAELALLAVNPRLHEILRRIYDKVGKMLAHYIQHPYLADLAYLLLKPWEWLARLVLRFVVPGIDSISTKMYTK
jgi:hypothetical protein